MKTKPSIPKVSILISVFNQLHCLDRALSSALNQDYSNIEIIIGDDFSTDGDVKVFVSEYKDHRIKYFKNPQNFGANLNYKTMLTEHASGTYAVVLNADDYWTDLSFISKAINLFSDHADMSLVFGEAVVFINSNDKFIEDRMNIDLP